MIDSPDWAPLPGTRDRAVTSDEQAYRALDKARRVARRREVYGRTPPRGDDLCAFDVLGMDIIEGRA